MVERLTRLSAWLCLCGLLLACGQLQAPFAEAEAERLAAFDERIRQAYTPYARRQHFAHWLADPARQRWIAEQFALQFELDWPQDLEYQDLQLLLATYEQLMAEKLAN